MGKGSQRRPCLLTREAENLQWKLAYGKIAFADYEVKVKKLKAEKGWYK